MLSEIEEGNTVRIKKEGSYRTFYVICQNYEQTLNGENTLVLDYDQNIQKRWNDVTPPNEYSNSSIDSWLNNTYKTYLDPNIIPFINNTTFYYTNTNNNNSVEILSRDIFLLSATEIGQTNNNFNKEGEALLSEEQFQKFLINNQWARTSVTSNNYMAIFITVNTSAGIQAQTSYCNIERYIQPVFTLNPNLIVDTNNNIMF